MTAPLSPDRLVRPVTPWTADEKATLRKLWHVQPQLSASAIGARMNRTKGQVVGMAGRMELTPRQSPFQRAPVQHAPSPKPAISAPVRLPRPVLIRSIDPTATCQWPLWSDRVRPTHEYCGAPVKRLGDRRWSYCWGCCRKAYQSPLGDAA